MPRIYMYISRIWDGWCNLRNTFQGHRCVQPTACAKGYHHAECRAEDWSERIPQRSTASSRVERLLATVLSRELSLTTAATRQQTMRRGREASRAIKNTEESEKEQKYETITQRGVALLLEATDAMEMSDRRRRGSAWIVVIAVFHFAPASYEHTPHRPGTPYRPIKTRRLWTPLSSIEITQHA